MESINTEITKEKSINSPLKHQKHRKGKFSEAVLPSAFGSHKKFEFHSPDLMAKDEVDILLQTSLALIVQTKVEMLKRAARSELT